MVYYLISNRKRLSISISFYNEPCQFCAFVIKNYSTIVTLKTNLLLKFRFQFYKYFMKTLWLLVSINLVALWNRWYKKCHYVGHFLITISARECTFININVVKSFFPYYVRPISLTATICFKGIERALLFLFFTDNTFTFQYSCIPLTLRWR